MKKRIVVAVLLVIAVFTALLLFALPNPLFDRPSSIVLYDRDGELLGARIADDEQWRFPVSKEIEPRFERCILLKEDRFFRLHPGVNPISLLRALYWNVTRGQVVSGGSTISMQVIRLSRGNPPRTHWEKAKEVLLALLLEIKYSKGEILAMYCTYAPFGGNVVGYETASWRYFQRGPEDLSWSELATLAVLPNAPGLIHPGRNRRALREKRDALLRELQQAAYITEQDYQLACLEELPGRPLPLPDLAPHLLTRLKKLERKSRFTSHIKSSTQRQLNAILNRHVEQLSRNKIHNGGILLINNNDGTIEAYVGNVSYPGALNSFNDMLAAPRSSGSILKPFLYAAMLESGELMPDQLVSDIPTHIGGFAPQNFDQTYAGVVPASEALSRSLNVPAVRMLKDHSVPLFLSRLKQLRLSSIDQDADYYGLSLILGGAEVTALDLGRAYSAMAQKLNDYSTTGEAGKTVFAFDALIYSESAEVPFREASIYQTFQVLTDVNRPVSEAGWQEFGRSDVAWKTGTSYGHRDAWAVGVTPEYTCVVIIGNATGEGRPGLVGAVAAGPVLFDVFNTLGTSAWFTEPTNQLKEVDICSISGFRATENCNKHELRWIPASSKSKPCPYHQRIWVDEWNQRVLRQCAKSDIRSKNFLVLPPVQAWYYSRSNPTYKSLPEWSKACTPEQSVALEVVYPQNDSEIFIPDDIGNRREKLVMEVAHRDDAPVLYWHLNGEYIAQTETFHQLPVDLPRGDYRLHVEDMQGNVAKTSFRIVSGVEN
jgi:penicillin-binding protein 1C